MFKMDKLLNPKYTSNFQSSHKHISETWEVHGNDII